MQNLPSGKHLDPLDSFIEMVRLQRFNCVLQQGSEPNVDWVDGTKVRNASTCSPCSGNTATYQVFGQVICAASSSAFVTIY